jgi:acyl carrier protein
MSPLDPEQVRSFVLEALNTSLDAARLSTEELSDELDLQASGVIDSLGLVELIAAVEERFGVEVDFEELDPDELTVVGSFCRYVAERAVGSPV